MGADAATFAYPLFDAIDRVADFVNVFVYVYILLIFAYVITSWIRMPYSLSSLQRFLHDVVEPYLRLFRRLLPPLGPLDLSPVVAVFVLVLVGGLVRRLLDTLH
jgi:uncharacterized protein YggT (Ycf19 family)